MTDPLYAQQPPKRNLKPFIFIAVLAIVIIGVALILGGGLPSNDPAPTPSNPSTPQGSGLVVDPNASDNKTAAPALPSRPGVAIPGFGSITIPADTTTIVGINLHNPEANEGLYYLTYKISLLDGNGEVSETLYESQLLPPGKYLPTIEITRGLSKGTYDAVMFVQPYRIEDTSKTNSANLKFTINVV